MRYREFAEAAAWLKQHALAVSATAVAQSEMIVLACARRGQFNAADVQRLRCAAPLARIVALTGSWCEGPWRRPCDALPGVAIVPWHRFAAWASVNRRQLARRRAASWSLPETTTADELANFWSVQPLDKNHGLILIDTEHAENADVLVEILRSGGYSAVSQPPGDGLVEGVRAIVCEADDARTATRERIAQLSRRYAPSPVVAVVNFPRADNIEQILAAGAAAVVGKPFTLHEILAQLGDALQRDVASRTVAA